MVVMSAVLLAYLLSKLKLAVPRPIFTDIAASFLVAEGLAWFLSRTVVLG